MVVYRIISKLSSHKYLSYFTSVETKVQRRDSPEDIEMVYGRAKKFNSFWHGDLDIYSTVHQILVVIFINIKDRI